MKSKKYGLRIVAYSVLVNICIIHVKQNENTKRYLRWVGAVHSYTVIYFILYYYNYHYDFHLLTI